MLRGSGESTCISDAQGRLDDLDRGPHFDNLGSSGDRESNSRPTNGNVRERRSQFNDLGSSGAVESDSRPTYGNVRGRRSQIDDLVSSGARGSDSQITKGNIWERGSQCDELGRLGAGESKFRLSERNGLDTKSTGDKLSHQFRYKEITQDQTCDERAIRERPATVAQVMDKLTCLCRGSKPIKKVSAEKSVAAVAQMSQSKMLELSNISRHIGLDYWNWERVKSKDDRFRVFGREPKKVMERNRTDNSN
ncbi:uncharacterized protein LOC128238949 [Mya arenaria]|uniref:uncharacterized protein LOC128238949 n=1 Tax=Mya arenaria TaxID=6604 RepID=UPI0022E70002|nr:uncharacterized protein LOC128238949 [Mya arenaria]